jgi:hypothetical protein
MNENINEICKTMTIYGSDKLKKYNDNVFTVFGHSILHNNLVVNGELTISLIKYKDNFIKLDNDIITVNSTLIINGDIGSDKNSTNTIWCENIINGDLLTTNMIDTSSLNASYNVYLGSTDIEMENGRYEPCISIEGNIVIFNSDNISFKNINVFDNIITSFNYMDIKNDIDIELVKITTFITPIKNDIKLNIKKGVEKGTIKRIVLYKTNYNIIIILNELTNYNITIDSHIELLWSGYEWIPLNIPPRLT